MKNTNRSRMYKYLVIMIFFTLTLAALKGGGAPIYDPLIADTVSRMEPTTFIQALSDTERAVDIGILRYHPIATRQFS